LSIKAAFSLFCLAKPRPDADAGLHGNHNGYSFLFISCT